MLKQLPNWLLPQNCLLCQVRSDSTLALCHACKDELPWLERTCQYCAKPLPQGLTKDASCGQCAQQRPYFEHTCALFHYQEPLNQLISDLKFQHQLKVAQLLGTLMAQQINTSVNRQQLPQAIIPVPLHAKRIQQRGFNQAIELARVLATTLKIPLLRQACIRTRHTTAQTQIKAKKRSTNVKGAFSYRHRQCLNHVAIIDDVMTTGSTANECARVLKQSGVERVEVWCVARTSYQ